MTIRRGRQMSVIDALRAAERDAVRYRIKAELTELPSTRYAYRMLRAKAEREVGALKRIAEMRNGIERKVLTI